MQSNLSSKLSQSLAHMGVGLSDAQQIQLLDYVAVLLKWNKVYNLTAITDEAEVLTKHILDSLTCLPYLKGERVIDVGTGGGLPGMVLAIADPARHYVLLDSRAKKTQFLSHAVMTLNLKNVEVVTSRVESYIPETLFDTIATRAFSSLGDMLEKTHHLLNHGGEYLAMKGQKELLSNASLTQYTLTQRIHTVNIPGFDASRHIVVIK